MTSVNSNHLADYLFRCVPFFCCYCCFRLNCAATHVTFCDSSYSSVLFSSYFLDQRERKEEEKEEEKEEKKTRLLFILISKQKRIFTEDYISFKYVISCFLKWESLLKWKPSVTHYRYKNMFLRFLTNKAYFDKTTKTRLFFN